MNIPAIARRGAVWAITTSLSLLSASPTTWAADLTLKHAQQGDAEAQMMLGLQLLNQPNPSVKTYQQAQAWFKQSAQQNHIPAQFHLGRLLIMDKLGSSPQALNQQISEGLTWLLRAAQAEHRNAQLLYAQVVLESTLVKPLGHSKTEAETHLNHCAQTYAPCAHYALTRLEQYEPQNLEAKRKWLRVLADQNDVQAMMRLAELPSENSAQWIRLAATKNDPQACYILAKLLLDGQTAVLDNDPPVTKLLLRSAEQDHAPAMFLLATLLYDGNRFPMNRPYALYWLRKGSAMGHEPSKQKLKQIDISQHKVQQENAPNTWGH